MNTRAAIPAGAVLISFLFAVPAMADSTEARCDIYPAGSDKASDVLPCSFSQRQGYVTISRDDGVVHDLSPIGDAPGTYRDQAGKAVYRESGLGTRGQIYRFESESVFVYWGGTGLTEESDKDNWTAPFSTDDYDATTRLRCRAKDRTEFGDCPAGILRMEGGQASIVVQSPKGEQFTINFMKDYVNATNREVKAELKGDTWTVIVEDGEVYEVPLAAIEGG